MTTYFMIKPHAIRDGVFTDILKEIETEFHITYLKWFKLTKDQVSVLYKHHAKNKKIFPRISDSMVSGPVLVVCIDEVDVDYVQEFVNRIRDDYPQQKNKAENYLHTPDDGQAATELALLGIDN